ncbi:hypothetical protein [Streptomyces sp. NPDC006446]|uniref:hypothetical protein n=1 Tax=Streptomyces sp. NPDC006446 TaxID=3154301 RepID=UPI0033AFE0E5
MMRKLGGTARRWRFDRMATVCYPSSRQVTAAFAGVAKYYGAGVGICPPRRGNRKGVVQKANHAAAQRWWRTVPDHLTVEQAQSGVDKRALRMDERRRKVDGMTLTFAELAAGEPLLDLLGQAVPGRARSGADGQRAEFGVLPRQLLFGAARHAGRPGGAGAPAG